MSDEPEKRFESLQERRNRIQLTMDITRFRLPPVQSVLVIGKRAGIGPRAMENALAEMVPDAFQLLLVEHETAEAIVIRKSHLRTVPQEQLVSLILRNCENLMDQSDMLHVDLSIRVRTTEEIEVPG